MACRVEVIGLSWPREEDVRNVLGRIALAVKKRYRPAEQADAEWLVTDSGNRILQ